VGFSGVKRMRTLRRAFFAISFCLPVLAAGQTAPAGAGQLPNPTLQLRPPPKKIAPPSPVTPEGRIHLDVVVSDAEGKPAMDLLPPDFTILDNDKPRKVLSFRAYDGISVKPDPPVEVILLVDTVNLRFQESSFVRQEIARFLRQSGGKLAQPVSIMLLSGAGLRVQPRPSSDGNALVSVLDQIKGSVHGIYGAMGAEGDMQRFQLSLRQMTVIAENEARKPGRKLLIWVGPGWPMLIGDNYMFNARDQIGYFKAIVELSSTMREARMALYSVSPANSGDPGGRDFLYRDFLKGVPVATKADTGNLALKVLAAQSGGRILGPDNDVAGQINNCIADANAFYRLSFNPPAAEHADEYHDLKVVVDKPGLTVRTTSGYYGQP